jgi:hypothetical protein
MKYLGLGVFIGAVVAPGELNVCSRNVAAPASPGGALYDWWFEFIYSV